MWLVGFDGFDWIFVVQCVEIVGKYWLIVDFFGKIVVVRGVFFCEDFFFGVGIVVFFGQVVVVGQNVYILCCDFFFECYMFKIECVIFCWCSFCQVCI